jgi:crotonobetainyl-CoA:carnitine CoA-transferase CaiB-like acyl-CoA transferase
MEILQGVKILDFTRLLPGPLATQLLAQMGAEVIKVEHPKRADIAKGQPPFVNGSSTLYQSLNFAKDIRTLDYTQSPDKDKVLALIQSADVMIEQFRPGVMAQWGLAYEDLVKINPQLIYISLSGYGQDGPYAHLAGHDINYLAYSGMLSLNCDDQGKPIIPGVQIADIAGGSYGTVMACLAGLFQRSRTGKGAYFDVAMLDALVPLLAIPAAQQFGGMDPYTFNVLSGGLVNYNVYECADTRWMALGALEIKFWNAFCTLVGQPTWQRQQLLELSIQVFPKHEIEALFRTKTQAEWVALTEKMALDVCLSPVLTMSEIADNPHHQARKTLFSIAEGEKGSVKGLRVPFLFRKPEFTHHQTNAL